MPEIKRKCYGGLTIPIFTNFWFSLALILNHTDSYGVKFDQKLTHKNKSEDHLLVAIDRLVGVGDVQEEVLLVVLLKNVKLDQPDGLAHAGWTNEKISTNVKPKSTKTFGICNQF